MRSFLVALILLAGCTAPTLPLDPQHLRQFAQVEILLPVHRPTRRIIHILDWHFVSAEAFQADTPDGNYEDHLTLVRTVQANQRRLLESLSVEAVYVESLTPENLEQFKRQLTVMQPPMESESGLSQFLQAEYELDLLRIGAVGQLAREGKLDVLPAEDQAAYERANPIEAPEWMVSNEVREDAIVEKLLAGPPVAVIVLGMGHDLRDNIERLSDGRCEYVRMSVEGLPPWD